MKDYRVLKNSYYDSVTLMSTTVTLKKDLNLEELVMFMGTDMNKEMIASVGLYHESFDDAKPNDLMLAVITKDDQSDWVDEVMKRLTVKKTQSGDVKASYRTIHQAKEAIDSNLAVISVPGIYAAHEAFKALENDMHVMLFSDNVSITDEIALKEFAIKKNLLVMGPDCGTAIINGKGLCFANQVRRGNIGLVAASGTGLQEVTVIIDRFSGGISQAIGVGGRDLSKDVGGLMMLKGIDVLDQDDETKIIVLVSKPPHQSVLDKILEKLKTVSKPVVLCLLDAHIDTLPKHVHFASTLSKAALCALKLSGVNVDSDVEISDDMLESIQKEKSRYHENQKYVKGLFCGGTLTAEALSVLRPHVDHITSNVAKLKEEKMDNPLKSRGHNLVDLGDDIFTQGKPHPMIEPTIRLDRILYEASLPETKVILLDFELGLGSHDDPVGVTLDTIKKAQELAEKNQRHISFVAYVCGTEQDSQGLKPSEEKLKALGVLVAKTNAQAALISAKLIEGDK
jgi:succinyl-CoA synthetase alpha subunit